MGGTIRDVGVRGHQPRSVLAGRLCLLPVRWCRCRRPGSRPMPRQAFRQAAGIVRRRVDLMHRFRGRIQVRSQGHRDLRPLGKCSRNATGVCQDFCPCDDAGLRGSTAGGLMVSGYLRTIPPPGPAAPARRRRHPTPGCRCGAARARLGSVSNRPTIFWSGNDHIILGDRARFFRRLQPSDGIIVGSPQAEAQCRVDVPAGGVTDLRPCTAGSDAKNR